MHTIVNRGSSHSQTERKDDGQLPLENPTTVLNEETVHTHRRQRGGSPESTGSDLSRDRLYYQTQTAVFSLQ